jgi:1-acyl-sn-glycerol-3-phosphate acyltransferase
MNETLVRLMTPLRRRRLKRKMRIVDVEVRGSEQVRPLLDSGAGVLIAPNHPGEGDVDTICHVADRLGRPFHFMAAWQVFLENGVIARWVMRRHGTFSVDREGSDMRAFRHAVDILQGHRCPLVIFPEGECYYVNDRVMPFLEGPAAMAAAAARKVDRPIAIVPCGIKFFYVTDPTPGLTAAMTRLEERMFWRPPRNQRPLAERIYRFAEAPLALKELEYLGHTRSGPLPERLKKLLDDVLSGVEKRHDLPPGEALPGRLKRARQKAIEAKEATTDSEARQRFEDDLDDLFLAAQIYSYPGDYVAEQPSIERIADTIKKFEEDVLGRFRPKPHGERRAVVAFGAPITVSGDRKKGLATELTSQMEAAVQGLLDSIRREDLNR